MRSTLKMMPLTTNLYWVQQFSQNGVMLEDSACLICSDDAKQEGAINERIIPTFLNPNESKHLFFSVLNLSTTQIPLSILLPLRHG